MWLIKKSEFELEWYYFKCQSISTWKHDHNETGKIMFGITLK